MRASSGAKLVLLLKLTAAAEAATAVAAVEHSEKVVEGVRERMMQLKCMATATIPHLTQWLLLP